MRRSAVLLALGAVLASAKRCQDITVPVSLKSRNAKFNLEPLLTDVDVTNFYLRLARQGGNLMAELQDGYHDVEGDYKLAATYCEPDDGPGHALQIMTHGVGFDRSYWDLPAQRHKYSYVDRAVDDHGYSTLTWDRLGIGASSKTKDTVNELQIALEIEALRALTEIAAVGGKLTRNHAYGKSIVHMGHSFGSAMTYDLVNKYPDISSGIVLTGFSQVPDYMGLFALAGNFSPVRSIPGLRLRYPAGYVGAGSERAVQINFFGPGDFDPKILDYMYKNGQPNTPGEILTVGSGGGVPNQFKGPAMIITGDRDVPFCGGDCMSTIAIKGNAPNLIENSKPMFPEASVFNATVVPEAGHGLFLGYSGFGAMDSILDFLDAHV